MVKHKGVCLADSKMTSNQQVTSLRTYYSEYLSSNKVGWAKC